MTRRTLACVLLLCLPACDDGPAVARTDAARPADDGVASPDAALDAGADAATADPCAEGPWTEHAVGGWAVAVDPHGGWIVRAAAGGADTLRAPARCVDGAPRPLARTATGTPFVDTAFGAFKIELETERAALAWAPVDAPATIEADADGVTIARGDARLVFTAADHGGLAVQLVAPDADGGELSWACAPDEGFFGLGTQVTGLDLRGRTFPLWTQEQGINKPDRDVGWPLANRPEAAYAPMGVWHSSAGYAAVIRHDAYSELDLCHGEADRVRLRSYGDLPGFVLVPGDTPKARMAGITAFTGRPPVVPDWTFAPWNDAVGGPQRLRTVAERLRAEGIPSSAIWSEDWIGGEQAGAGYRLSYAWEWDPAQYPDLPDDIAWLHARGFAFLAYFNTFVPHPTRMFTEGVDGEFLVRDADGALVEVTDPAFRSAALVDLNNPGAQAWMGGYLQRAAGELAIDGWMADFSEWLPVDAVMHDGTPGWTAHNRYPLDYQRQTRAAFEATHASPRDWLFFSRSGWASVNGGTSGQAPVLWAGDQNTDWRRDDGFPTVIPIGVHAGLAGVAFYGTDIAGYTSVLTVPNTTKELFFRWASAGALMPVMRTHHGSDECGNWAFDRDAETTAHFRRWAVVHTLLFPYLTALAAEAQATGVPLMRHPILVAPEVPALWREAGDQYFLGDDLLVAPVVEEGAVARAVHLPGPGWWPLFGDAPLAGGGPTEVQAAPTELPVFVRPGTALALLPEPVESVYGATEPGVRDLSAIEGRRLLALYPDADGAVAGERAAGTGWSSAPDWSTATVDDAPVPACADAPEGTCYAADRLRVRAEAATVRVGDAALVLEAGGPTDWTLAFAGAAWGEWAAPTPLTDLDPDIPPPCEAAE